MARRIARMASRPCRRASAASEVAKRAEHQPPFRPDAPNPATSRSSTATRSEGSASASEYAVQSPVNPAPTMQTSTSRSSVRAGRGGSGTGIGLPPEGETLIARCCRRTYAWSEPHAARAPGALADVLRSPSPARFPASVRTSRSVAAMKSISSCPQISGGESWTTGSPRSSARQIKPASKRAPDRKPRSSFSDSSSSKERRVSLSLTSSIP